MPQMRSRTRPLSARAAEAVSGFMPWSPLQEGVNPGAEDRKESTSLVESMLSVHERTPAVLTRKIETSRGPLTLSIGAAKNLTQGRPGNGGFRILSYDSPEKMREECVGLAQGMEVGCARGIASCS